MQQTVITEVAIKKEGWFWAVKTDGKLLAVVLYRKGAEALQDLVQRLAAIPVTPKADATVTKAPTAKPAGKKPDKQTGGTRRAFDGEENATGGTPNPQRSTINPQPARESR